jgi:amino acid transporter
MGTFYACCLLTILVLELSINTIGYDFLGTSGWFYYVLPAQLPMPFAPTPPNFALILYPNPIVAAIIGISMVAWSITLFPSIYMAFSRSFLAWSLDRILPKQMATVWSRTHSPIVAAATACGLGEIFLVAYYLVPADFSLNLILVSLVLFLSMALAALLFPFRLKDLFDRSAINYRIGGIPFMSILGVISILATAFTGYYVITDADIAGPVQAQTVGIVAAIVAFALILFFSRRAYLKTKGLDLDLVFKEIPIE